MHAFFILKIQSKQ